MKNLSIITLAFVISGCTIFAPIAEKVAQGVEKYCEEPYNQRQVYREQVNSELLAAGHSVEIVCAGDPVTVP